MRLYQRNGIYYVAFPGNKRRSLKIKDKSKALQVFERIKHKTLNGNLVPLNTINQKKFHEFRDEYLEYSAMHKAPGTVERDRYSLSLAYEYLGKITMSSITPKMLDDFQATLRHRGLAKTTINITFRHLKSAFGKAVDWKYLKDNPFSRIKMLKEDKKKLRYYTKEELEMIFESIKGDHDFHEIICLYLHTGMRRSELIFLEVKDIDFDNRLINIMISKTGPRSIPMDNLVERILKKRCMHVKKGRLFTKWRPNSITHRWTRLMKKLKINGRLHDLRHTFAAYLAMYGERIEIIQMLLGHSQIATTQIYAHLHPSHLRDSVSRLAELRTISSPEKFRIVS